MILYELAEKYRAGKGREIGGLDLISYYDNLFKDRREKVTKVLEIGIGYEACMEPGYQAGASLRMWEEYFPNAQIYALDNVPETLINKGRIKSYLCDQSDIRSLERVLPSLGIDFDLILDDGSHIPEHQILTANTFMSILKSDGIYIIEDVWTHDHWRDKIDKEILQKHEFKEFRALGDDKIGDLLLIAKAN